MRTKENVAAKLMRLANEEIYRLLCAGELPAARLEATWDDWRMWLMENNSK